MYFNGIIKIIYLKNLLVFGEKECASIY